MKRLFKRGRIKKKQGGKSIWKPEMVLLCYDHHENVKQIELNSDSGSSLENESDNETRMVEESHRVFAQNSDDKSVATSATAVRWTDGCVAFVANRKWLTSAIVVVGIALFIYLCLL